MRIHANIYILLAYVALLLFNKMQRKLVVK